MGVLKDETGKKYGRLTVLERAGSTPGGIATWKCRCDCGNETIVQGAHLRNGHTVSCGCRMREVGGYNFKDLTGQKFGLLTVIQRVEDINKEVAYECKCDCGNVIITRARNLTFNGKISCGCIRQSKGENIIEKLLKDNNIKYEKEKTFSDLVSIKDNKTPYRYDFYLPEYNRLIECDGEQHNTDKYDYYFGRPYQELQQIDTIKNEYAKNHNIDIIRIPYKHINNLIINDLLGSKFAI